MYLHDVYFDNLISVYSNDPNILKELYFLKDNYPNFPFDKYSEGMFDKKYIDFYGLDFLIMNSKFRYPELLEYGINSNQKDKVMYFMKSPNLKRTSDEVCINISLDNILKLETIYSKYNITSYINYLAEYEKDFNYINEILTNNASFEYIKNIIINFDIYGKEKLVYEKHFDNEFAKFIKLVDFSYFSSDANFSELLAIYEKNKSFLSNILKNKNFDKRQITYFNSYLFNGNILNLKINNKQELSNYPNIRFEKMSKILKSMNLFEMKEYISYVYFGIGYKELEKELLKLKDMSTSNEHQRYFSITKINSYDDAINFITKEKNSFHLINEIRNLEKGYAIDDLSKKLTIFNINRSNEILNLKGQRFLLLLHKIKGFSDSDLAQEIYLDPLKWFSTVKGKEYISTSLCSNEFMGMVPGNGFILGFDKIEPSQIIHMGPLDIDMNMRIFLSSEFNSKDNYLLVDEFIKKTMSMYNEVVINRKKENKLVNPSFVFAKDKVSSKDLEVSNMFNIPIYLVDSKIYFDQMNDRAQNALCNNDLLTYVDLLYKEYFSFYDNNEIIRKYFKIDSLIDNLNYIVDIYLNKYSNDKNKLFELTMFLKKYTALIDTIIYEEDIEIVFDSTELNEKIKKHIKSC